MDVLSVAQFCLAINTLLGELGEFAIQGEISALKISGNQALFIDLKDTKEQALLRLSNYAPRVTGLNLVREGMEVIAHGRLEMYPPTGSFSFKVRKLEPVGEGALKQAFEQLKQILQNEGLFSTARKREIEAPITKIALITAKNSAAYSDFTKILQEGNFGGEVDFYPVTVQGDKAETEIIHAFNEINSQARIKNYQVVVLIRGGGSLEDLKAFNSEGVARAVFGSALPVIVGVGHEIDVSIADFVADVRASTPSQAAYYMLQINAQFLETVFAQLDLHLQKLKDSLPSKSYMQQLLQLCEQRLRVRLVPFQLADANLGFSRIVRGKLQNEMYKIKSNLNSYENSLEKLPNELDKSKIAVTNLAKLLAAYGPEQVLERGYTLIKDEAGNYIAQKSALKPGNKIAIRFSDGDADAQIT